MTTIYLINQSSYDTGTLLHFTHDPMATKKDAHAQLKSLIEMEKDCMSESGYEVEVSRVNDHIEVWAIDGDWQSVFSITEIEVA